MNRPPTLDGAQPLIIAHRGLSGLFPEETQPSYQHAADAGAAGLFVHGYTLRNETRYVPGYYGGDPRREFYQFFAAGIDGVVTDFANTGAAARRTFLAGQTAN